MDEKMLKALLAQAYEWGQMDGVKAVRLGQYDDWEKGLRRNSKDEPIEDIQYKMCDGKIIITKNELNQQNVHLREENDRLILENKKLTEAWEASKMTLDGLNAENEALSQENARLREDAAKGAFQNVIDPPMDMASKLKRMEDMITYLRKDASERNRESSSSILHLNGKVIEQEKEIERLKNDLLQLKTDEDHLYAENSRLSAENAQLAVQWQEAQSQLAALGPVVLVPYRHCDLFIDGRTTSDFYIGFLEEKTHEDRKWTEKQFINCQNIGELKVVFLSAKEDK